MSYFGDEQSVNSRGLMDYHEQGFVTAVRLRKKGMVCNMTDAKGLHSDYPSESQLVENLLILSDFRTFFYPIFGSAISTPSKFLSENRLFDWMAPTHGLRRLQQYCAISN